MCYTELMYVFQAEVERLKKVLVAKHQLGTVSQITSVARAGLLRYKSEECQITGVARAVLLLYKPIIVSDNRR